MPVKMQAMKHVHANGIEFAYLEQGTGPLVLLLHGFPDNASSWSHQMPALAGSQDLPASLLRKTPMSLVPA